jgi:VanZ family protein
MAARGPWLRTATVMLRVAVRPLVSGSTPPARVVRWLRLLAPVAWAGFVLVASVVDPSGGPPAGPVLGVPGDKVLHGLTYATLAAALAVGLATPRLRDTAPAPLARLAGRRPVRRVALLAVLVATAYGLAIEGIQYPLPYRTFELLDAAANAVGAVLGAAGWVAGVFVRRQVGR